MGQEKAMFELTQRAREVLLPQLKAFLA